MPGIGTGPFLWLSKEAPPHGYRELPESGMCVSAFVFVTSDDGKLLLGKYAEHDEWERLAGLDRERQRAHGRGWTIPASQLKFGEDPQDAAARIVRDILRIETATIGAPRVGSDHYVPKRFPDLGMHYDIWFLFDATLAPGARVETPPWYRELAWLEPKTLPAAEYARAHEDVVARWLRRGPP